MIYETKLSSQTGPELEMCLYLKSPFSICISQNLSTSAKVILGTGTALIHITYWKRSFECNFKPVSERNCTKEKKLKS